MSDWFDTLSASSELSVDAACELHHRGFVVLPGLVPRKCIKRLGDAYDAAAHLQNTLEIIHVTKGTLTLTVGPRHYQVAARGSVVARMDQRHQYANAARSWLHMAMTVIDPAR